MKGKQKKKKLRLSLFSMLMIFSLIPLILSIGIISTTSLYITKNNLEESAQDTLFIVANNLASYCNENEINVMNSGDYYFYLDSLKDKNIEMAIIIEGAPCATSIKNENDYRIREIEYDDTLVSAEGETGVFDDEVIIDEKAYYGYYTPIESGGEIIGMAFAGELQENVTGNIRNIAYIFIGCSVFLVILFAIIILLFNRGLSKSFTVVGEDMNLLSQGDLKKQKEHRSAVKEMNMLLVATKAMQDNLSTTIGKVKDLSQSLVDIIVEVTGLSNSSSDKAQEITTSLDELSKSTMKMAENVQDINTQMQEIGNCINDISQSVEQLHSSSENILDTNNIAKENMNTIMINSVKSVNAINDITDQIKETNSSITEIDKAVELILALSDQTALLSLNASIEAARAGVHGRGFAVVAEEIRTLSEQSSSGAEMIKNLAQTITEKSGKSVELAEGVHSLILLEQENVSKTQKKYEELSEDINESVNQIKSIADKTENLTHYKEQVLDKVQDLSAISEENAACNIEVSDNINDIIAEVQTVNDNCGKMNGMAQELEESVSYFHI